ncbi:MAG: hypothetical protein GXY80_00165 [Syntrophorhabdus aromaticivorans]|uniref:Uncharacterized protein n=1 Tax=Syntrophorhabdus aromaticivorans TaxID=328301 RepID=A0A971M0K6_9BACT|nr:hypothetical protein [Syntrophorhabdus aromaticivorans]
MKGCVCVRHCDRSCNGIHTLAASQGTGKTGGKGKEGGTGEKSGKGGKSRGKDRGKRHFNADKNG